MFKETALPFLYFWYINSRFSHFLKILFKTDEMKEMGVGYKCINICLIIKAHIVNTDSRNCQTA